MEDERYQKELFDFDKPRRNFPKFDNVMPKKDFALTLNLEKTVFASIGIIMLMVIVFALGVERGKYIGRPRLQEKQVIAAVKPAAPLAAQQVKPAVKDAATQTAQAPKPAPLPIMQTPAAAAQTSPFMIVAATFQKKDSAQKEADRLRSSGYDSFIYQSGNYFLACISAQDKDHAKVMLSKVKKSYKDAYIKQR